MLLGKGSFLGDQCVRVHAIYIQYAKRDAILEIEKEVQRKWAAEKVFEIDGPLVCCGHPASEEEILEVNVVDVFVLGRRKGRRWVQEGGQVFLHIPLSLHEWSSSSWSYIHCVKGTRSLM